VEIGFYVLESDAIPRYTVPCECLGNHGLRGDIAVFWSVHAAKMEQKSRYATVLTPR